MLYQWVIEYADCVPGLKHTKKGTFGMTLNCIWWVGSSSGDVEIDTAWLRLHPGSLWPRMAVIVRVPVMCQADQFKINFYFIRPFAKKSNKIK